MLSAVLLLLPGMSATAATAFATAAAATSATTVAS